MILFIGIVNLILYGIAFGFTLNFLEWALKIDIPQIPLWASVAATIVFSSISVVLSFIVIGGFKLLEGKEISD